MERIGKYEIKRRLGEGATSEVYLCHDPFGSRVPDLEELDKASKSHAVWLAKNLAAVEKWRETLWFNLRDTLNHPSSIKRRYEATRGFGLAFGGGVKPLSAMERLKAENVRLQEAIHLPASANGVARWRSSGTLRPGTYFVQVMAVETGGITDCPHLMPKCNQQWSSPGRIVVARSS